MRRQKSSDRKKVRTKKLGEEREWGGGGDLAQHRQQHLLSAGGRPLRTDRPGLDECSVSLSASLFQVFLEGESESACQCTPQEVICGQTLHWV